MATQPVNPTMLGGANVAPEQASLEGLAGSVAPIIDARRSSEFDPYARLRDSVLKGLGDTFNNRIKNSQERAYLDGASASISGKAEESVETNMLTKHFAQAGYRDLTAKIQVQKYKADVLKDIMGSQAGATPAEFAKYLQEKRNNQLMPFVEASSSLEKNKLLDAILLEDLSLIQKQTEMYASTIQGELNSYYQMAFGSVLTELTNARGTSSYGTVVPKLIQSINDLMTDSRIDVEGKQTMIKSVLDNLNSRGEFRLVQELMLSPIVGTDGEPIALGTFMPLDQQEKIFNAVQSKRKTYMDMDNAVMYQGMQNNIQKAKQGAYDGNLNEEISQMWYMASQGLIPTSKVVAYENAMRSALEDKASAESYLEAYTSGNTNKIITDGANMTKIGNLASKRLIDNNVTIPQRISIFSSWASNGNSDALRLLGNTVEPAIKRIMATGEISPDDADVINAFAVAYNQSATQGDPNATMLGMIQDLPTDVSMFLTGVMSGYVHPTNITSDTPEDEVNKLIMDAFNTSATIQRANAQDTEVDKTRKASNYKSARDKINFMLGKGDGTANDVNTVAIPEFALNWFDNYVSSALIPQGFGAGFLGLRTQKGINSANDTTRQYLIAQADAWAKEYMQANPYANGDSVGLEAVKAITKASLKGNVGDTDYTFVSNYKARLGDAVVQQAKAQGTDTILEPQAYEKILAEHFINRTLETNAGNYKGGDVVVSSLFDRGTMTVTVYSKSTGAVLSSTPYNMDALMSVAGNLVQETETKRRSTTLADGYAVFAPNPNAFVGSPRGKGFTRKRQAYDDVPIYVNSKLDPEYSKGLDWDASDIIAVRASILEHEAVRWSAYGDGKNGNKSIGVGFSQTGKRVKPEAYKDGYKLTPDEMNYYFHSITTENMANVAKHVEKKLPDGANTTAYRSLITSLSYQGGYDKFLNSGNSVSKMNEALAVGDVETAEYWLQQSPPFKQAGEDRQQWYLQTFSNIFRN